MVRPGGHRLWYMVWPGGIGMLYGMIWRTYHGIWYGLAGMAWYMACSDGHSMVYGMAWRAWHGMYMIRPGGHGMFIWYDLEAGHGFCWRYSMTWRACSVYGHPSGHDIWYGLVCMASYMVWPDSA